MTDANQSREEILFPGFRSPESNDSQSTDDESMSVPKDKESLALVPANQDGALVPLHDDWLIPTDNNMLALVSAGQGGGGQWPSEPFTLGWVEASRNLARNDLGNARRLVDHWGDRLRWAPELGQWLIWDWYRWAVDITGEVDRFAKYVVDELLEVARTEPDQDEQKEWVDFWDSSCAAGRLRAMVDVAKTEPGIGVTVAELDSHPWLYNVLNGTIDLHTGKLRSHDRSELHTKVASVECDPDAQAPTWEKFLLDVFAGDVELIGFLQRYCGYGLTGDTSEQCFVFAHGVGGNGKSTLANTLRSVMGDYAITISSRILTLGKHEEHPTGVADLRGARFVTTSETEQDRFLAEELIKDLTGSDPIRARRMRRDFYEFQPTHKIWMAGNYLPRIQGTDHGIWRRVNLLLFGQTFPIDNTLADRLAAEKAGILAWLVRGCLEWQGHGLQVPEKIKKATEDYRAGEDHMGRFLAECTEGGNDTDQVLARSLRFRYESWCERNGEKPWSAKAVGGELTRRGFTKTTTGHDKQATWVGFRLVEVSRWGP
jgi:putative DNA primase/helicase